MRQPHTLSRFALASSLLAGATCGGAIAQIAYVDGQGREWRQVELLVGTTWLEVAEVCPTDGSTPCSGVVNGQSLEGWVWATDAQVTELFAEFVPQIVEQPSLGGPSYVLAALFFFGSFNPTFEYYTTFGGYNYLSGWTASSSGGGSDDADQGDAANGVTELGSVAAVSATWNAFDSSWDVGASAAADSASVFRGVWLVKLPPAPCPADFDGSGEVDAADLGVLLGLWGPTNPESADADLDGSGTVDAADLGALLAAWGTCG